MGTRDPRVDAYVDRAAEFARPILSHIRETVHDALPEVEETIKWGMPHFMHHGIVCGMAAFKEHCALGFPKGSLLLGAEARSDAMGQFGSIRTVKDLPPKRTLAGYIKRAAKLNADGVKVDRARSRRAPLPVPDDLTAALRKNRKALATFEAFPPSHRRDYVEWVTDAKRDDTRKRRIAQAVEWIAEGKSRNWKYMGR